MIRSGADPDLRKGPVRELSPQQPLQCELNSLVDRLVLKLVSAVALHQKEQRRLCRIIIPGRMRLSLPLPLRYWPDRLPFGSKST